MAGTLSCVICNSPLTADLSSEEHVIPNALGGRLVTRNATCVKCNSLYGHGNDSKLIQQFQLLANYLDIIRDRGDHPKAKFTDSSSGQQYHMEAGKKPFRAPRIEVEHTETGLRYRFNAPSKEAGECLYKKMLPKKPHIPGKLNMTKLPVGRFNFEVNYSADDEVLLRNIARIAINFIRYIGIPIGQSDTTVRFARGENVGELPVGPPRSDVISISGLPRNPLYHGIFLSKVSENEPLFAYVFLFQFCDFIVRFNGDCSTSPIHASYQQNLVTGLVENRPFKWIIDTHQACEWINNRKINPEHSQKRFAPLKYYMAVRERLWVERATGIAMNHYLEAIKNGATKEQASADALEKANQVLSRYEMTIESLDIKEI